MDYAAMQERLVSLEDAPEQILGMQLNHIMATHVSGARANLEVTEGEQIVCLVEGEIPFLCSGYSKQFGEYSSSTIRNGSDDLEVLAKVEKFPTNPGHIYTMFLLNHARKRIEMITRKPYAWSSENYGFLTDNSFIDNLEPGHILKRGELVSRSIVYNKESSLRTEGRNLNVIMQASDRQKEDSFEISESAAKKFASSFIERREIILNNNMVPTNLYGDREHTKSFPWIGEEVNSGILMATRVDIRDERIISQSVDSLLRIYSSDSKYHAHGKVIDIDILCNNPDELKSKEANSQVVALYEMKMQYLRECLSTYADCVKQVTNDYGYTPTCTNEVESFISFAPLELGLGKYERDDKKFTGTILQFHVLDINYPVVGDKMANCYGGKGVIGKITPDYLMPYTDTGEVADIIVDQASTGNRLNVTHNYEQSVNMFSHQICAYIYEHWAMKEVCDSTYIDTDVAMMEIMKFLEVVSPMHRAMEWERWTMCKSEEEKENYLMSIISSGAIHTIQRPVSDSMDLDDENELYDRFPYCGQYLMFQMAPDSNNVLIEQPIMRPMTMGYVYYVRLKQTAKEKFSVCNIAPTNQKNTPTRSRDAKIGLVNYRGTPIMMGNMEAGNIGHAGMAVLVTFQLIYSLAPQTREEYTRLLTDNPYNTSINVTLDSSNRAVEVINAQLKQMGVALRFTYRREIKPVIPFMIRPFDLDPNIWPPNNKAEPVIPFMIQPFAIG